ncbi:pectinesterase 2-like [Corylus avellana]|uniref:pectinesterase 2-like n=1 Tax=Corylus avellana TaxID=13451 RepID=UPI00286ADE08|nr:pectinesterase 2-like [Corylus avellana]
MRIHVGFTILSLFFLSFMLPECSPSTIQGWCSQTPHPQPCQHFIMMKNHSNHHNSFAVFQQMTKQIALDQALKTQRQTIWLRPNSQNIREKAAWADCIHLFGNTIHRLKQTIGNHGQHTDEDVQTWLSSALTNLDTCQTGFTELGVSSNILPLLSNVSKLVTNALATNKYTLSQKNKEHKIPTWRPLDEKKVLQDLNIPDIVVAKDGSGNFTNVQEAVDYASKMQRKRKDSRFVMYVKVGIYEENVEIGWAGKNITMVGDGIGKTIITASRSVKKHSTTYTSATVAVDGDGFMARDMTFRNSAGPSNGQAVALRSGSDLSAFYRCSFEGYQDTLYVHSNKQFFRECDIYGTVDFIFGNAAAVFQNCNIYSDTVHTPNAVTAQGRTDSNQTTGIVIQSCRVRAFTAAGRSPLPRKAMKTYLGRPWKKYSRTIFIKTYFDGSVDPAGWMKWDKDFALNTLYYGEYKNRGSGSSTAKRVKWGGFHLITSSLEASNYTVSSFISGGSWLPSLGVPFTPGL